MGIETPAVIVDSPQKRYRQLRKALRPFVQEYKEARLCTPDLINYTWTGIWGVISERAEFDYQVLKSDRTAEELAQLQEENRDNLLLPDGIYTPKGLVGLGRAFPLMGSWTITREEAVRISHSAVKGGSFDIEMSPDAPYRTRQGYTEQQLRDTIATDGRRGMRLPTYIVGSQFSKLLTGHYFDEKTWSRILGSFCGNRALAASFFSDGSLRVGRWLPSYGGRGPDLGGRSEGEKIEKSNLALG
ncbi:hypothetical protein HYU95_02425 [Candidatus Daviesbacteria bacterium]|nr:hypothetical protein [Candidatus Daviesbacteria bacterium]